MNNLVYISIFLAGWVVVQEFSWIGKSDLAWIFILLAVAIGLQGIHLLRKDK